MVDIIWSTTNGGPALNTPVSFGTVAVGATGAAVQVYVRHTGTSAITGCRLFIQPYSANDFSGIDTPQDNYEELAEGTFGPGLQLNINSDGFPEASYINVGPNYAVAIGNAANLGTIPAGDTPNVSFKLRFAPLALEEGDEETGKRQFNLHLTFLTTD